MTKPASSGRTSGINRKTEARVAAVKVLYAHAIDGGSKSLKEHMLDIIQCYEDGTFKGSVPDTKFLRTLLEGVEEHESALDGRIAAHLSENWSLERMGPVMQSLLRVAVYELMAQPGTPLKVIVNEYVSLGRGFFPDEKEVGFINGLLDKLAREIRE